MSRPKHAALGRPATFGDVFRVREYRFLYAASALSWGGDYLARAAVTALVFRTTGSVALSAASLAVGYLPWFTVGPVLTALAERYPRRTVMVTSDIARTVVIGVVAVPGLPIPAVLALLFVAAMFNPPFDASRSALLPSIITGDRYVVALSVQNTTTGFANVGGYFLGALAAPDFPHVTLAVDAATFLVSAALIGFGIKPRDAGLAVNNQTGLIHETVAGFRLVLSNSVLRAILVIVLGATMLSIVPEGLAAAWASHLDASSHSRGIDQAQIMMSVPAGTIVGALIAGRLFSPELRWRLIRPCAIVAPVALTAALLNLPAAGVAAIGFVVGLGVSGITLPANGIFVQALPSAFRARAFGVILFGFQLVQVAALLISGLLADRFAIHAVVGLWGVAGIAIMVGAVAIWPQTSEIEQAIDTAQAKNQAAEASAHGRHSRDDDPEPADEGVDDAVHPELMPEVASALEEEAVAPHAAAVDTSADEDQPEPGTDALDPAAEQPPRWPTPRVPPNDQTASEPSSRQP